MGVAMTKTEIPQICFGEFLTQEENCSSDYEFDLIIVGGGSGGLACAKQAAKYDKRVALCDFVKPSPAGSTWGLGGTCVNVGCIPKKLMHQASLVGKAVSDASAFGWDVPDHKDVSHDWDRMVENIQRYIASLNWGYRVTLQKDGVTYFNAFAEFLDNHTLLLTDKKGESFTVMANHFVVAVGGRPRYLEIPGGGPYEHCITSDDLFSLKYHPGKVLLIGAGYIALECAGFLAGLGVDSTILARSILLRDFDQQIANMIGASLEEHGVRVMRGWVPEEIQLIENGTPPQILVIARNVETDDVFEETFNTVVLAIGRDPCTQDLMLENAGVKINPKTGKIYADDADTTNVVNIFAIGDVAEGRLELTPVAIEAGMLLAKRLYGGSKELADYDKVPTTVFTPIEYGCCGLSEEEAIKRYGDENVEVYHISSQPLEFTVPERDKTTCYSKYITLLPEKERVLGFHYLGPNAGEVTQGFALAMKMGATKTDFEWVIGIHPTCAEVFTNMNITKRSGLDWVKTSC